MFVHSSHVGFSLLFRSRIDRLQLIFIYLLAALTINNIYLPAVNYAVCILGRNVIRSYAHIYMCLLGPFSEMVQEELWVQFEYLNGLKREMLKLWTSDLIIFSLRKILIFKPVSPISKFHS